MYSRSSTIATSRSHRSKGNIKVKHILQVCVLTAICFWLIYQAKPPHAELAQSTQSSREVLKLGRKDVSRAAETVMDSPRLHERDDRENEADEEEKESVESRIGDRKEEEDRVDDEVQDDLVLDEDKETDDENEENEAVLEGREEESLIVPGFVSAGNATGTRGFSSLTESNATQSKSDRGLARKGNVSLEESEEASENVDDSASNGLEDGPLDYSGLFL